MLKSLAFMRCARCLPAPEKLLPRPTMEEPKRLPPGPELPDGNGYLVPRRASVLPTRSASAGPRRRRGRSNVDGKLSSPDPPMRSNAGVCERRMLRQLEAASGVRQMVRFRVSVVLSARRSYQLRLISRKLRDRDSSAAKSEHLRGLAPRISAARFGLRTAQSVLADARHHQHPRLRHLFDRRADALAPQS